MDRNGTWKPTAAVLNVEDVRHPANEAQNRLILNALEWLGTGTKAQGSPGS
jgi:hypothetical protein